MDLAFLWEYIAGGPRYSTYCTLQVDRWTYIADGLTLQVVLLWWLNYITGGLTLQMDLHCRWSYFAG